MFTGIIRQLGTIQAIDIQAENHVFTIAANFGEEIRVDQSIAHNGVCLTVTDILSKNEYDCVYKVTAVRETLEKTNLGHWSVGQKLNLELCMRPNDRLDGHFVQGHVDTKGKAIVIEEREGSWIFEFEFSREFAALLVNKGSVTINGVSLTVVKAEITSFSVTIIPYTYEFTQFHTLKVGDYVNLEFDILGKYMLRAREVMNA